MQGEPLSDAARQILGAADLLPGKVKITSDQLAKPLYEEVNEFLTRLGAKWQGGRTKAHVYKISPESFEEQFRDYLADAVLPPKNPLAFFPTADAVTAKMVDYFDDLDYTRSLLEPSAGDGAIVRWLREYSGIWSEQQAKFRAGFDIPACHVDLIEPDHYRAKALREHGLDQAHGTVYEMTFEEWHLAHPDKLYHRILMNPPFTLGSDQKAYIRHIRMAYEHLEPGGELVSVAPNGFTFRADQADFLEFVHDLGRWDALPKDAFKDSGTNTSTVMVYLRRPEQWEADQERTKHNGFHCADCYYLDLLLDNDERWINHEREDLFADVEKAGQDLGLHDPHRRTARRGMQRVYEAARREFSHIKLSDECWYAAMNHLADQYHEWHAYRLESEPWKVEENTGRTLVYETTLDQEPPAEEPEAEPEEAPAEDWSKFPLLSMADA